MSTSYGPILLSAAVPRREPLRLRMAEHPGRDQLDGGWWPQSRNLAVELADLVDHFPADLGRIVRARCSPPDWDAAPRRVLVARGYVKVGSFRHNDTHLIDLTTSDHNILRVLVVPPRFSEDQGTEALLASATSGNAHTATDLLDTVTDSPDVDPFGFWDDDGGATWDPTPPRRPSGREPEPWPT